MKFSQLTLLVSFTALVHGKDASEGTRRGLEEPLKRQTPPCSSNLALSPGHLSSLTIGNNPHLNSCTWRFTCPANMYLQCSVFTIPCPAVKFFVNQTPICGSGMLSPRNAGTALTVAYYRYFGINGARFTCTVTCSSASGSTPTTTKAPTTTRTPTPGCTCGVSQVSQSGKRSTTNMTGEEMNLDRIVGGVPVTDQRKYPWMAYFGGCGGALIDDRYILTAAHCVSPSWQYQVTLGDLDKSNSTESRSITIDSTAIVNPQYQANTSNNDIALLRLNTPVNFQAYPNIRPICLSSSAQPVPGQNAAIAGWGTTSYSGSVSSVMMEAAVTVENQTICENAYNPVTSTTGRNITGSMFCASSPGKDACQGDSGGPVMLQTQTGYFIEIGLVSWGFGCANANYPGVYTRVANYVNNFIRDNTGDAKVCPPPSRFFQSYSIQN